MKKIKMFALILVLLMLFTTPVFAEDKFTSFGIFSLIPPLLAIALAFITKQVVLSLFLGIFSGVLMLNGGNIFIAYLRTIDTYILGSLANNWSAAIIIFTLSIGGMIGIISKMGGTKAIAEALAKKAKNAKSAQLATIFVGMLVFFADYASVLIVGPTMRPLTDKMRVSREKLSYIVDSTAAPIAGIALISTWVGYQIGLIANVFTGLGVEANFFMLFVKTIPFSFYNILSLVLIFTLVLQGKDYGPMYVAEKRARLEGKLVGDDAKPMSSDNTTEMDEEKNIDLKVSNAIIPIVTITLVAFCGLWYSGYVAAEGTVPISDIRSCYGYANPSVVLVWASLTASIVAGIMAVARKIMSIGEAIDAWIEGCKSIFISTVILVLAWTIGSVVKDVGTAKFLIQAVSGAIPGLLLPIIVFAISCVVAFSTGTSWGTMAIVIPLAVPLASSYVTGDPTTSILVLATLSSVLSGAIFGDHCSPISDTTIMSSMGSGSDHIDHVKTQMPYSITGAVFAMVAYLITGILSSPIGIVLGLIVGIVGIIIFVKMVGKKTDLESLQNVQ